MLFKGNKAYRSISMSEAVEELMKDKTVRLLDVRTQGEYRQGHIPGSINLPANRASEITQLVPDKNTRLFVYCQSGGRSQMACEQLTKLGYSEITSIGGMTQWRGDIERGEGA
ncbi:MAG: rhodanese-like domain-containing protein [Christensenellales bacterium]